MSILHMETEQARDTALRLDQAAAAMDDHYLRLKSTLASLSSGWEGGKAERFEQSLKNYLNELRSQAEGLQDLSRHLRREVDEWEEAATSLGGGKSSPYMLGQMSATVAGMTTALSAFAAEAQARADFKAVWDTWTLEQRTEYLQGLQDAFAKKNGVKSIKIYVQDIDDPVGMDARGYRTAGAVPEFKGLPKWFRKPLQNIVRFFDPQHTSDHIVLDVDNVLNSDPWEVQETLFHESRHQVQHVVAKDPAHPPAGISQQEAQDWADNFKDYKLATDDFQAYRDQPIEADARAIGASEVDALYQGGTP